MSDGGKGSGRRKEDLEKVRSNWDLIDWGKRTEEVMEATKNAPDVKVPCGNCHNCGNGCNEK